eukprot:scaffold136235_cov259-Phaeocystis_antarctica.AAC.1
MPPVTKRLMMASTGSTSSIGMGAPWARSTVDGRCAIRVRMSKCMSANASMGRRQSARVG